MCVSEQINLRFERGSSSSSSGSTVRIRNITSAVNAEATRDLKGEDTCAPNVKSEG